MFCSVRKLFVELNVVEFSGKMQRRNREGSIRGKRDWTCIAHPEGNSARKLDPIKVGDRSALLTRIEELAWVYMVRDAGGGGRGSGQLWCLMLDFGGVV